MMESAISSLHDMLNLDPWLATLVEIAALLAAAVIANWITKRIVVRLITRLLKMTPARSETPALGKIVRRLSNIVPALVIHRSIILVPHLPPALVLVTQNVAAAFITLTIALAMGSALDLVNHIYDERPDAGERPIKGLIQVGKIVIYSAATILIIAALMDRSPLLLLSGLGAMAAIVILVFKDTILSLVAALQLRSNDMLRVGDWIEMPQLNADGNVIDIALHTVKVQNWDMTITTIPSYRLIAESFKNWRGMADSGRRRIKRSLFIDQNSIGFLTPEQWASMTRFELITPYLEHKQAELRDWNAPLVDEKRNIVNMRRATNIGTFRAYAVAYLQAHPHIAQDSTLLVRQLAPTAVGLPIEIYCFTDTTVWNDYEAIQSDIFDHFLSILPEFGLRLFQEPSGYDFRRMTLPPA